MDGVCLMVTLRVFLLFILLFSISGISQSDRPLVLSIRLSNPGVFWLAVHIYYNESVTPKLN